MQGFDKVRGGVQLEINGDDEADVTKILKGIFNNGDENHNGTGSASRLMNNHKN